MTRADVFALPCRIDAEGDRDAIPVVLMEAMACSLPVITGDLPSIRELVTDGCTGLLHPSDDATALATGLERLAADFELADQLVAAGRVRVAGEIFSGRQRLSIGRGIRLSFTRLDLIPG